MSRQALNTLFSLSGDYQQDVSVDDYEVIIVENRSNNIIGTDEIGRLKGQFFYFLRDEKGVSPAPAINFGLSQCRSSHICLMIDGARMVTPGVIRNALDAITIDQNAMVIVPGYNLGTHEQHQATAYGYDESAEIALLESINWPRDGYRLFDIASIGGANPQGIFHPFMECNCLFVSKETFVEVGAADERFDMRGGGALNLAIYRRLAMHPRTRTFLLPGEGSFHQYHGGVTTSAFEGRDEALQKQLDQLNDILGAPFRSPTIQPALLGAVHPPAMRHLLHSAERGVDRAQKCAKRGENMYADEARKKGRH